MSCLAVRTGAVAIVGYSLGALTGNVVLAGLLAAAAGAAMVVWSRIAASRAGEPCTTGCGSVSGRGRHRAAGSGTGGSEGSEGMEPEGSDTKELVAPRRRG